MNQAFPIDKPTRVSGRFGRLSYLAWTFLSSILLYLILFIIGFGLGAEFNPNNFVNLSMPLITIFVVVYLVFIYFFVVFMIRRLHDRNHSGWLGLLMLVPGLNIIFALYLLFAKGTSGINDYGPQRVTLGWEKVLGWLYISVFFLGLIAAILIPTYQSYVYKSQQTQTEQSY